MRYVAPLIAVKYAFHILGVHAETKQSIIHKLIYFHIYVYIMLDLYQLMNQDK